MGVAVTATLLVVALTFWPYWGFFASLPLVACSVLWARENMRHHAGRAHAAATPVGEYPRLVRPLVEDAHSKWWWGTMFLIVTEALLFVAGLLSLTAHPVLHDPNAPEHFRNLNTPLALVASLVLWSSGATTTMAQWKLKKGNVRAFRWWLVGTLVLATVFLGWQANEYWRDVHDGFTVASGAAGSIFYALTGLHGLHVLAGMLVLLLIIIHAATGGFTRERKSPAEAAMAYWHFVEAIWIAIYGILYLKLL